VTYYRYPTANCTAATRQLTVGYTSSSNGGSSWTRPTQLAGPWPLSWLAYTSQGRMVGDYISTSISGGRAWQTFAVAKAPAAGTLDEAMYVPTEGLAITAGVRNSTATVAVTSAHKPPAAPPRTPLTTR
jgi:hypothetical protein